MNYIEPTPEQLKFVKELHPKATTAFIRNKLYPYRIYIDYNLVARGKSWEEAINRLKECLS